MLVGLLLGFGLVVPATAQDVSIEKSTNGEDADAAPGPVLVAGDPVNWTYEITAGIRDLENVVVTDDQGVAVSCPQTTLGAGSSMTCTASGVATTGQYANLGTVNADFVVNGQPVTPDSDPSHYFGVTEIALSIEKSTEGVDADSPPGPVLPVGGPVTWTYLVTNESSTDSLSNVSVTDDQGVAVSCPQTTLTPGESMTCTGSGTVQPGQYANIGEASGELPGSILVVATDPSHYRGQALVVEKATNGADADSPPGPSILVGDPVTWTYLVGNPGPEAIDSIVVTDDQGVAVSCPQNSLAPGASMVCTGSGTAVAGPYANLGTASAQLQSGPAIQASDPSHYTGVFPSPIDLEKATNGVDADSAPGPVIATGDPVSWTYVVTNVGTTSLTSVTVTDDQGVAVSCPQTTLAPGQSMTCSASGVAIAGPYENLGTATAISGSEPVEDSDFSHYFGSDQDIDYGDAPDPTFPTLFALAGASHVLSPTVFLGACVDSELDGSPSAGADGDDLAVGGVTHGTCAVAGDDEDGVTFLDPLVAGALVNVEVVANAACTLTAWIDFNVDGDWNEPSDALFPGGVALVSGVNALSFTVPGDAFGGNTHARFRCTTDTPPEGGVFTFFGQADDGEVEDYLVSIELDLEATLVDSPGTAAVPGDTISYEATVSSVAGSASGVEFDLTLDPNTLASGGVTTTPLARDDGLYEVDPAAPTSIDGIGQPLLLANDFGIPTPSAIESLAQPTTLGGTVDIASDGSFTYTPFGGAVGGEIDSFTYDVENGVPAGSPATDTATATLILGGPPVAVSDNPADEPAYTIAAGSTLTIIDGATDPVERNDFPGSPAGSLTSFGGADLGGAVTDNPAGSTVSPLPGFGDGSLTVNGDGSFTFVTPSGFTGLWQFDYRLTNTSGTSDARVTIEVQEPPDAIDDGPGASPGDPFATLPDTPIDTTSHPTPSVLANDVLGVPAGVVTFYGTSAAPMTTPAEGGPTPTDLGGTVEVSTNGEFVYNPPAGTTGTDAFGYVLGNGAGSDSATVMILIASPPAAENDAFTVLANTVNPLDAAADNGSGPDDFGDPVGAVDFYGPVGGPLTTTPGNPFALPSGNTVNFTGGAGDGTFTYDATINPTFSGVESFDYQVTNVAGSDVATVTVTVQALPDAVDDFPDMLSSPGDPHHTALDTALDSTAHATPPVLTNDDLGFPAGALVSYGTSADPTVETVPGAATPTDNGGTVVVAADGNFTYTPPNAIFTGPDLFGYRLENAAGTDDAVVTVAVGERSACVIDGYDAIGNVGIVVPAGSGLLVNDSGDQISVSTVEGASGNVGVATATDGGGSVTVAADGSFTYINEPGDATDTFQYTVGNGFGDSAECTVTITLNETIWFIDNSAAPGGDGTLATPFDALADMGPAADGTGDIIFVDEGQTGPTVPYDGGITLLDSQQLIGQGVDLATASSITIPPFSPALPGVATAPSVGNSAGNGINLGSGNNVAGLDAFSGSGSAIAGSGIAAGTFDDVTVSQGTASGIDLLNTTGTFTFTDSSINTTNASPAFRMSGGTASVTYNGDITQSNNAALVDISNHSTGTVTFQNGTLSATSGTGLQFSNADGAAYSFSGTTTLNGGDAGIDILGGSAGTFTFGTGTSITSPTGTAFNISGDVGTGPPTTFSGSIVQANNAPAVAILNHSGGSSSPVIFDGSSSISATSGTGLQFNNADRVYEFNGPVTLSGGDAGIDILSGSQGTFTFANTTITSPSGTAFNVNGGSSGVTYSGGGITQNNAATAYAVTGHFGATHNISVPVTANTSSATGISLVGSSGSVNFSGGVDIDTTSGTGLSVSGGIAASFTGTNTLDTTTGRGIDVNGSTLNSTFNNVTVTNGGANPAVNLVNSPGTKTFNAMSLTTTTGAGLNANNAGTISVTGGTNTISTTTATAINITNTTIGATDVTFQSVSSNGGTDGIVLNNTGTSGGLKITGNGGNCADDTVAFGSRNCTGGVIQSKTTGISLTNTSNVSLGFMRFHNIGGDGIVGTGVTDGSGGAENSFGFLNSEMVDVGTDASAHNGIDFGVNTADGTFNISGDVVVSDALFEHDNVPTGTVSGNAFAQSALRIENQSNVTMNLDVTDSVFRETPNNADDAIKVIVGNASTTTVDVQDSVALNVRGGLLFLSAEDNLTAADVNFERNEVRNTKTTAATSTAEIGSGVVIAASNGADVTFDIRDNCPSTQTGCTSGSTTAGFYRLFGDPIDISANTNVNFDRTTFEGRIVENRIENTTGDMIGIFGDAEDGTSAENPGSMRGIVLIDDNVLVGGAGPNGTSSQNGIDLRWRDGKNSAAAALDRELDITITDNEIGFGTPLNDDGINFLDLSNQTGSVLTALLVDVLIDNNTISVTDDSAVSLDIEDSGVMNATVTNNTLTTTSGNSADEALELKTDNDAVGNFTITANTLSTSSTSDIELDHDDATGTFNVLQTSSANLTSVNNGATVDISDEAITFNSGITPTLPTLPSNP